MKNIKTFTELNEVFFFNKWNKILSDIKKDLNINLYFISTFGAAISAFFPFFDNLTKNSNLGYNFTQTDIILLVIASISILLKENKKDINKLIHVLKEKDLYKYLNDFTKIVSSVSTMFSKVTDNIGKSVNVMVDMFAYTALFVPFLVATLDVIHLYDIDFKTFNELIINPTGAVISLGVGMVTITLKSIINMVVKKIKRGMKGKKTPSQENEIVQKFENFDTNFNNFNLL